VPTDHKAALRAQIRVRRDRRDPTERARVAQALARHVGEIARRPRSTVAAYVSMPAEPGTGPSLAALTAAGHRVLVPRIDAGTLAWASWEVGGRLAPGPFGILEPTGPVDPRGLAGVDVVLLPALAVDTAGHRLGQGGGYYDRALAHVPTLADGGPQRVAVVFADEVLDALPHEPHDATVDAVLTESGLVPLP